MELAYNFEGKSCKYYVTDYKVGFFSCPIKAGETLQNDDPDTHHMLFILSGKARVQMDSDPEITVREGQTIFIPKGAKISGIAEMDLDLICLSYEHSVHLCDRMATVSLIPYAKDVDYKFHALDFCPALYEYVHLLSRYLKDGLICSHLHDIKQRELFLLFRTYYSKEERASFFFHAVNLSEDFKAKVYKFYLTSHSVKELSTVCGYSLSTFHRLFLKQFNMSPYQWMLEQNARHVRIKLLDTTIPIKTIAKDFGFSSQAHLTSFCKKYLGKTPLQLRLSNHSDS